MTSVADVSAQRTPLQRKLDIFYPLDQTEEAAIESLETRIKSFARDATIVEEGSEFDRVYIVQDGWAMRYKSLADGRRQILSFALPGDFVSLEATIFKESDSSVSALTDLTVAEIDPTLLLEVLAEHPQVALAISWCAAREESILAEHVVSTGRRSAYEAVAHLLIEIWRRLQILGLTEDETYRLPVTQNILADSLGLSQVHTNRTLKHLQRDELIDIHPHSTRVVSILDKNGLEAAAGFHDGYLHFTEMPHTARKFMAINGE